MIFSKNKVDLKAMKEKDPEGYAKLVAEAKEALGVENTKELEDTKAKLKAKEEKEAKEANEKLITDYGKALGAKEIAAKAVKDGVDFKNCLQDMVDQSLKNGEDFLASFEDTASEAAGVDAESDDSDQPKDFQEAYHMIAERDGIDLKAAAEKAKTEFEDLLDKKYDKE